MTVLESNYSNEVSVEALIVKGGLNQKVEQGKVELSWEPLEVFFKDGEQHNTTHYVLKSGEEVLFEVGVEANEHTLTEVLDGIEQNIQLFAVDKSGPVEESTQVTDVLLLRTAPSVPQNLSGEALSGAVKLTWDKIDQEEGKNATATDYFVYRSNQEGTSYQKIGQVALSEEAEFIDSDVHEDTVYYYVVTTASVFEE